MNPYMKEAKELANKNLTIKAGGPFGACVVKNGKIIGRGYNKVLASHDPTAHAEIEAIRDACQNINTHDLSGCEIYTTSYPCPMCFSAIIWANIQKCYYGNSKEDTAKIGFRDDFIYHYIENLMQGIEDDGILSFQCLDREETIKEYEKYQNQEDKVMY